MVWLGNSDNFKRSPLKRGANMVQGGRLRECVCQFLEENGYFLRRVVIGMERAVQRLQLGKHQRFWRDFGGLERRFEDGWDI